MVLLGQREPVRDKHGYGYAYVQDDGNGQIKLVDAPDKLWVSEDLFRLGLPDRGFLMEGDPAREGALLTLGTVDPVRYVSEGKRHPQMDAYGFVREFLYEQ